MEAVLRKMPGLVGAPSRWTVALLVIMALGVWSTYWSGSGLFQSRFITEGEYPFAQLLVLQTEVIDHVEEGGGQVLAFSANREQQKANVLFAASPETVEEVVASVGLTQAGRVGLDVQSWEDSSSTLISLTLHLNEEQVDSLRQEAVEIGLLSTPLLATVVVVLLISPVVVLWAAVGIYNRLAPHWERRKRRRGEGI